MFPRAGHLESRTRNSWVSVSTMIYSREVHVLDGLLLFELQLLLTRSCSSRQRWATLNWDEEWEVRANATARADWVILHFVITLITLLPRLSLYLDWSLPSGARLHLRKFICDSLSSSSQPISHNCPILLLLLWFFLFYFSAHLSHSSFLFVCCLSFSVSWVEFVRLKVNSVEVKQV